METKNLEGP